MSHFDFAVVEQCYQYNECDAYKPFIDQDKAVLIAEYAKQAKVESKCDDALANKFSLIRKKLSLTAELLYQCTA